MSGRVSARSIGLPLRYAPLYGSLTSVLVFDDVNEAVNAAASAFLAACFAGVSFVTYGVAVILHCVVGVPITKKRLMFPGCESD